MAGPVRLLQFNVCLTDLQQIVKFGEPPLFQTGESQCVIDKYSKLAFLLADNNFNFNVLHLIFQFCSETRCTGLVPSGSAIHDSDFHLIYPFFGCLIIQTIVHQ